MVSVSTIICRAHHLWPDSAPVARVLGDVNDPILADPWLKYMWDSYMQWMRTCPTYTSSGGDQPNQSERDALLCMMSPHPDAGSSSYLATGQGKQILESVLFGDKDPLVAAREMLAGLNAIIEGYYQRGAAS
jgi:hypothetical protein